VLELGCGDGGNALAIAQTLPEAQVVGVDASPAAIARGRALAQTAGLTNVELRVGDLLELARADAPEPADYVIAHGVYSWIPPAVRGAVLECCRRRLTPHGIAFVSYNAYPGSYLRDMTRDILAFHLQGVSAPAERLARAQQLMETIVAVETPSPYARVLREHLQRMLQTSEALLYHDDLAPISTPFYFHEFMEHAAAHGLQFLSEAELSDSQLRDVPTSVGELIASLPDDVIAREQYLDFFNNRMFRRTLLIHSGVALRRAIDDRFVEGLAVSSPARPAPGQDGSFVTPEGVEMSSTEPLVAAMMHELGDRWPSAVSFDELTARAWRRTSPDAAPAAAGDYLRGVVLEAYVARLVTLDSLVMPVCARPPERPLASGLARAQCAADRRVVSTLIPGNHVLDTPLERRVLPLLDGTRDRAELAAELHEAPEALNAALDDIAAHGLLSSGVA
jgi:SAM-dependent methyltransferase